MKASGLMSTLCILLFVIYCGCEVTTYVKLMPVFTGSLLYSLTTVIRTRTNSEGEPIGYQKIMVYPSTTVSSVSWDLQTFTSYSTMISSFLVFYTTTITTTTHPDILITLASTTITIHGILTTTSNTAITSPASTAAVTLGTITHLTDIEGTLPTTSTWSKVLSTTSTDIGNILTSKKAPTATVSPSTGKVVEKKPNPKTTRILVGLVVPAATVIIAFIAFIFIYRRNRTKDCGPNKESTAFGDTHFPKLLSRCARNGKPTILARPPRPESLTPSVIEAMIDPQIHDMLRKKNDSSRSSTAARPSGIEIKRNHKISGPGEPRRAPKPPKPPSPSKVLIFTVPYTHPGPANVLQGQKTLNFEANTSQLNEQETQNPGRQVQRKSQKFAFPPVELEADHILVAHASKINVEREMVERAKALAVLEGHGHNIADDHSTPTSSVYSRDEHEYQNAFEKRAEAEKREREFYQGRSLRSVQVPKEILEGGNGFF